MNVKATAALWFVQQHTTPLLRHKLVFKHALDLKVILGVHKQDFTPPKSCLFIYLFIYLLAGEVF